MQNVRFDMCGLGITLGQNGSQAPQAACDLAKAILDDLGTTEKQNVGRLEAGDEAEAIKEKVKSPARSDTTQATDSRAEGMKSAVETQPSVEEDQDNSGNNDSGMVADNSMRGELSQASDDEDAITMQAIDAEERQEVSTCFVFPGFQPHMFRLSYFPRDPFSIASFLQAEALPDEATQPITRKAKARGDCWRHYLEHAVRKTTYIYPQPRGRTLQRRHQPDS